MHFQNSKRTVPLISRPGAPTLMALVVASVGLLSNQLQAQTVYRSVDSNGRITFSDKPPVEPIGKVTPVNSAVPATPSTATTLPLELRQVAGKFPVTLYASDNCAPCDGGRRYLVARGVPFFEKIVTTAQDVDALKTLTGATTLPFLTIGHQHVAGYSNAEWTRYLNAAGYPEHSKLPANYNAPVASALVPVQAPPAIPPTTPAVEPVQQPVLPAVPQKTPGNPAGIQF
jgi:glutaredoxin